MAWKRHRISCCWNHTSNHWLLFRIYLRGNVEFSRLHYCSAICFFVSPTFERSFHACHVERMVGFIQNIASYSDLFAVNNLRSRGNGYSNLCRRCAQSRSSYFWRIDGNKLHHNFRYNLGFYRVHISISYKSSCLFDINYYNLL